MLTTPKIIGSAGATRRLAVLHVTPALGPRLGGPSKAATEICRALAAKGIQVSLFTTDLDDRGTMLPFKRTPATSQPSSRRLVRSGVEVRKFETRWPSRFVFSPDMARELRSRIAEFDVVHIHSLYLFPTLVAAHYARKFGIPYIVRPHGTLDPYMLKRHRIRKGLYAAAFERRNLDRAAAIHFTTHDEMRLAAPLRLKAPGVVVPLGVRADEFINLPRRGSFREVHPELANKRLIVFIGRIVPKKGLDLLIESFAQLSRDRADLHLVLAGTDEDGYGSVVRRLIRRKGLSDRTLCVGHIQGREKLALLADADVWVLASYSENFGMAVVEAMACGLPVIITNKVNIHDEVARARAGLVIGCDSAELVGALRDLLENPAVGSDMGDRGRALVRSKFTWESAANKLIDTYGAIVSGSRIDT